jgi:hypothetical protein
VMMILSEAYKEDLSTADKQDNRVVLELTIHAGTCKAGCIAAHQKRWIARDSTRTY